jgi:hypothetical protein
LDNPLNPPLMVSSFWSLVMTSWNTQKVFDAVLIAVFL